MVPVRCLLQDPSILDNLAQSLDRVKVTWTSEIGLALFLNLAPRDYGLWKTSPLLF